MLVASREKEHFHAMPDRISRKSDRGATSPAVILCSCVGSGALYLIRRRIPVPLIRTWRHFHPSTPTDVRHFSPGLAVARFRCSRAGSLPTDMAPRVRRSALGTVTAAHGVTAAAAARVGAAAVRDMTATARARVVRELKDEAVILIRNVRRHFEREMAGTWRILLKKHADRTAVATGVSRRTVSHMSSSGAAERTRPAGTPKIPAALQEKTTRFPGFSAPRSRETRDINPYRPPRCNVHGIPRDQKSAPADQHGILGHGNLPIQAWPLRNGLAFPPPPHPDCRNRSQQSKGPATAIGVAT